MAFREVFVLHAPGGGATLRHLGRYMYETLIESGSREVLEPPVRARVRAAADDMRFSAQVLAELAAEAKDAGLPPEEAALAMKADSWAREILGLVRSIEGAAGSAGGLR
jgi:hypothetical protein